MAKNDALDRYRKKRDFTASAEPSGKRGRAAKDRALIYVVQRHEARRLHYDFRLEWNGVLLSWAVPKGPSLDPEVKRLAVHVEDHPVEYASFQGNIPKGHYGAGHVEIWDSGTWTPHGDPDKDLAKGHLRFDLDGGQLGGGWMLIRMSREENQWILRKLDDGYAVPGHDAESPGAAAGKRKQAARGAAASGKAANAAPDKPRSRAKESAPRAKMAVTPRQAGAKKTKSMPPRQPLPDDMAPQLATLVDAPPPGSDWSYEVKYDGYRMMCRIDGKSASFVSRNDIDWTARMKGLATAIGRLGLGSGWLDGEVVVFDENGVSSFQALQNALDGAARGLVFVVFDVPFWEGLDLRDMPLRARQDFLEQLLAEAPDNAPLLFTQRLGVADTTQAKAAWTEACRLSLEGLICKRIDAPYRSGRTRTWLKLKCRPRQEFVVGGYTSPGGSRAHFGALLLGLREDGKLKYVGRAGTGFNAETLASVMKKLKGLAREDSPFDAPPARGNRFRRVGGEVLHWVEPRLVAEIAFAGWTGDKLLRQAAFVGLREDKEPVGVGLERPVAARQAAKAASAPDKAVPAPRPTAPTPAKTARPSKKTARKKADPPARQRGSTKARQADADAAATPIAISHPDRLVYRSPDITKLELARYYATIAPYMLPHVAHRRLALLRCPQGTTQPCFFQKKLSETTPPEGIELDQEQIVITSAEGLLALVQRGVVEFHTWGSSVPRADRADRITIDLDPDPNVAWAQVVEAAQLARTLMEALGLAPYLKTTGGKGLHLVAPVKPTLGWDEIKAFTQHIALHLARMIPDRFTANMSKQRRTDRVFVDYLRNGNGATAVSAFSARVRQGAPVSMPIAWEDLDAGTDMRNAYFHVANALDYVSSREDPWAGYETDRKTITKKMRALVAPRR
jgi:bifunctional non-homologous end joining protein LigD